VKLSVIVPAFNESDYLPGLLSSLQVATLALKDEGPSGDAVEVIVVDNASTDGTATIAVDFGVKVVAVERRGIAIARNAGAAAATGDVLVFIDADYRVLPSFLTRLVHSYESDPAMAAAGVRVALEPIEIDPITRTACYVALMLLRRFKRMSFGVATFRRPCFETLGGYDESLYALEDVEILEQLAEPQHQRLGRYRILNDVLVFASPRGFYRGGFLGMGDMLGTYVRMAAFPAARRTRAKCAYWYERD
jgi:glycosyltransferase involved in cell wall biosynthesis